MQDDLQSLCERGQQQLVAMDYLGAERLLVRAEHLSFQQHDFDTLHRLYMPLQEARRQRRLFCGEGIVRLDLLATTPTDSLDAEQIISSYPHGQLLIAGWESIDSALRLRKLQEQRSLYVETFLAAVYSFGVERAIVIVPTAEVRLPAAPVSIDDLLKQVPPHSIVMNARELPHGQKRGDSKTFAFTMALWERLHRPFLAAAEMQLDPLQKIAGYRRTIEVDYACELAHQKLADVARELARHRGS